MILEFSHFLLLYLPFHFWYHLHGYCLSVYWLVCLRVCPFVDFLKEIALCSSDSCIVFFFYFIDFFSDFDYFLLSTPHSVASFSSFLFHRAAGCNFKLLIWELSNFFMEILSVIHSPFIIVFIVSHKFGYLVPSF